MKPTELLATWADRRLHRQLVRFGFVGAVAAALHSSLFVLFVHIGMSGVVANSFAFLCSFSISYAGHSRWTFKTTNGDRGGFGRFSRFGVTTAIGFMLNTLFAFIIVDTLGMSAWVAAILMVTATPAVVFLLLKLWVFA